MSNLWTGPLSATRNTARLLIVAVVMAAAVLTLTPARSDAAPVNVWNRIARCESGGHWHINTHNGYYGGLQFSLSTWRSFGGRRYAPIPNRAARTEQITVAKRVRRVQGWRAWPVCSRRAGVR